MLHRGHEPRQCCRPGFSVRVSTNQTIQPFIKPCSEPPSFPFKSEDKNPKGGPCVQSFHSALSRVPFCSRDHPFPSLPQAEKSARLKDTLMRLKNNIFSGPITNLLSMLCFDENLFILQRKKEQRGLKVSNFAPSYSVVIFK